MIQKALVILVILGIVGGAAWFVFGRDTNPTQEGQHLVARYATLSNLLDDGSKNAQRPELRQFVSEARILVSGEQASLTSGLATIGVKKAGKEITAAEADSDTFNKLKEASVNGQYDVVYPKVLEQKLDSTAALLREVNGKTSSKKLKAALSSAYSTLSGLQDRLSKL